jgi:hypothetical protein
MTHPEAYARRILVNLAFDGARGRGQRRAELDGTGDSTLERLDSRSLQPVAALEDRGELIAALGALPHRQRLMLVLRYFADLSEEQTARDRQEHHFARPRQAARGDGRLTGRPWRHSRPAGTLDYGPSSTTPLSNLKGGRT